MEAGPGAVGVEAAPAVERVEERVRVRRVPNEEMPGHADTEHRGATAPADLHHEDAQGDGDAAAPRHHVVEEGVPRILVVRRVTLEAELAEEVRAHVVGITTTAPGGELVEPGQTLIDVHGSDGCSDEQRGLVEREVTLRGLHETGEP